LGTGSCVYCALADIERGFRVLKSGIEITALERTAVSQRERKILGGWMVGTHAGDRIGEVALAIEMGAVVVDIGKIIHPHHRGESPGMEAEIALGSCTDVPPARR